jgi:hypothetical protein
MVESSTGKVLVSYNHEGGKPVGSGSLKLIILFRIGKNYMKGGRSLLLYLFIRRAIKQTVLLIEACHCYQLQKELLNMFL